MPIAMKFAILGLTAFLVASPRLADAPAKLSQDEGAPFVESPLNFADESACIAHLVEIVKASARPAFDAAAGPYRVAAGDMRAHRVRGQDWGHEIEEYRCLAAVLSTRRWNHAMIGVKPFTVEDIANMSFPAT